MTRFVSIAGVVLLLGLGLGLLADDPPGKLTPQERKALEAKWEERTAAGIRAYNAGRHAEAIKAFEAALEMARRLYPKSEFPDGHENLATSLNNLAELHRSQGKYAAAEPL